MMWVPFKWIDEMNLVKMMKCIINATKVPGNSSIGFQSTRKKGDRNEKIWSSEKNLRE